jgi:hypothetical protein
MARYARPSGMSPRFTSVSEVSTAAKAFGAKPFARIVRSYRPLSRSLNQKSPKPSVLAVRLLPFPTRLHSALRSPPWGS